jgi:L-2-hydroxyglutarate oxidase
MEPHVRGLCAIRVPTTGIVDYTHVCRILARNIEERGGEVRLSARVDHIHQGVAHLQIETTTGTFFSKFLINCAGLQSDRVAKLDGGDLYLKIVPFRGEYFELKQQRRYLVRNLIYPVPNPNFPFLGVHYTRMIGGQVTVGPNAVLAFKREGYKKTDFDSRDFLEVMTYKGFWKLACRYWKEGLAEMIRSYSKAAFVRRLQQLIPEIQGDDLLPAPSGVRAQALRLDGSLVDDFHIIERKRSLHVCNAPSPAATASLEIGNYVANQVPLI